MRIKGADKKEEELEVYLKKEGEIIYLKDNRNYYLLCIENGRLVRFSGIEKHPDLVLDSNGRIVEDN